MIKQDHHLTILSLKLDVHLSMTVFVLPLTPKLMHTLHNFARNAHFTIVVAAPAASVVNCSLSCSNALTSRLFLTLPSTIVSVLQRLPAN